MLLGQDSKNNLLRSLRHMSVQALVASPTNADAPKRLQSRDDEPTLDGLLNCHQITRLDLEQSPACRGNLRCNKGGVVGKFLIRVIEHEIESAADLEKGVVNCFGTHDWLILMMLNVEIMM